MGKSLRSKSKLRAKLIKRKGEFSNFVDSRNKRLAEKLEQETEKQDEEKKKKQAEAGEEAMDVETDKSKKVTTSGWRDSRKQIYKQRKLKSKKSKTMKF